MASQQGEFVLGQIRRLALSRGAADVAEPQLLERFLSSREEAAFAGLVERHGPMVLGVCRRVLRDAHDAEDAFQATFLVLACKADSVRHEAALGSWLYRVAYSVAVKARADAVRRRAHERQAARAPSPPPAGDVHRRELCAVLDEQLQNLPEKYRAPLILHYLQGRTKQETARQLGWTEGTVSGRLARARDLLRARLVRRGVALALPALGGSLAAEASAAVPATLLHTVTRSAVSYALGQAGLAGTISARVAGWAQSVAQAMGVVKVRMVSAALLGLALLTGTVLLVCQTFPATHPPAPPQAKHAPRVHDKDILRKPAVSKARTDWYGDPLPPGARARMGTVRLRPPGKVAEVLFSPDGKVLVTAAREDAALRLWDFATGRELRALPGYQFTYPSRSFAADSKFRTLAGAGESNTVRLWDVASGKEIRKLTGHRDAVISVAFAPDHRTLVSAGKDQTIRVWDVGTGKLLRSVAFTGDFSGGGSAFMAGLAPDGKTLAVRHAPFAMGQLPEVTIKLWDVASGKELPGLKRAGHGFDWVAFSPDGKTAASSGREATIRLWDLASGKELLALRGKNDYGGPVAFTRDGKTLLTTSDREATLWDVATGRELAGVPAALGTLSYVALSPDGKALAGGSFFASALRLWDAATGKELHARGHAVGIDDIALARDAVILASVDSGQMVRWWRVSTGKEVGRFDGEQAQEYMPALAPDGKLMAAARQQQQICLRDPATGREIRRFRGRQPQIARMVFSPDGKRLAVADNFKQLHLWDVTTGRRLRALHGHRGWTFHIAFSPGGTTLAAISLDDAESNCTIHVWRVATGRRLRHFPAPRASVALAYSADGRTLAAAGAEGGIHLYQAATGKALRHLSVDKRAVGQPLTNTLAFSPDGKTLASGGTDGVVTVWELAGGQIRRQFRGHRSWIKKVVFANDSKTLVSAGDDTTALVWDVTGLLPGEAPGKLPLSQAALEALWTDLGSKDAVRAYRAVRTLLVALGQAPSFLRRQLRPATPEETRRFTSWVADLDSQRFAVRQRAIDGLGQMGELAEPVLRRARADRPSLEARQRIDRLLSRIASGPGLRSLRALEVLEHLGTKQARDVLQALAKGSLAAQCTREARAALKRLGGNCGR